MKTLLRLLFIVFIMATPVYAQESKWTIDFNLGLGGYGTYYEGGLGKLGIGISHNINNNFFVRLGADFIHLGRELAMDSEDDFDFINIGDNHFSFLHFPISVHYRWNLSNNNSRAFIFGIGPSLNFTTSADKYKFNDNFSGIFSHETLTYEEYKQSLDGKPKIKGFNIAIQPSVVYQANRHLRFGLAANLGLLDLAKDYEYLKERIYIYELWATACYYFEF